MKTEVQELLKGIAAGQDLNIKDIFKEFPERYINMQLQGWQLCDIKFDNVINMKISKQQYISSNFTYFDKKIN